MSPQKHYYFILKFILNQNATILPKFFPNVRTTIKRWGKWCLKSLKFEREIMSRKHFNKSKSELEHVETPHYTFKYKRERRKTSMKVCLCYTNTRG